MKSRLYIYLFVAIVISILMIYAIPAYRDYPISAYRENPGSSKKNNAIIDVFYGTDRNVLNSNNPKSKYGTKSSNLTYGISSVSIPIKVHEIGKIEAPKLWRLEFVEDYEKHFILMNAVQVDREYFYPLINADAKSSDKKAFIFIHGYNVSFEDAAKRTAQMAYDLKFHGVPVFYSWPSKSSVLGYFADEATIRRSRMYLKRFLKEFSEKTTIDEIYIIAHSMGTRGFTEAFASLVAENPNIRNKFKEIILAAPDIDATVFVNDIAPRIVHENQNITLYSSQEDRALSLSSFIHGGYDRTGQTRDTNLIQGIETIDVSNIDSMFLKHSTLFEERPLINDLTYLINNGIRAEKRATLENRKTEFGEYWEFAK